MAQGQSVYCSLILFAAAFGYAQAGPVTLRPLTANSKVFVVGKAELIRFQVEAHGVAPGQIIEACETDASGNLLWKYTPLFDDGSPAHNDHIAGDGIYNGINALEFKTAGKRYFIATVEDAKGIIARSSPVMIEGKKPWTAAELAEEQAMRDRQTATINAVLAHHGSAEELIQAMQQELLQDPNVNKQSIQVYSKTGHCITWESVLGIRSIIDADQLTSPNSDTLRGSSHIK